MLCMRQPHTVYIQTNMQDYYFNTIAMVVFIYFRPPYLEWPGGMRVLGHEGFAGDLFVFSLVCADGRNS